MALTLPRRDSHFNADRSSVQMVPRSVQQLTNTFVRPFKSVSLKDLAHVTKSQRRLNRKEYLDTIRDRYKRLMIIGNGDIDLLEENPYYQALMKQRFFDPTILGRVEQALYMFTNDAKYEEPKHFDVTTGILIRELIHHIFNFNQQIGAASVYGMAYTFGPPESDGSMVVKYSANANELNEVYHEWIIGHTLNRLRSVIPNFVYTLGCLVGCSAPISQSRILSPTGKVASWCSISDKDGKTPYLILERIYDPIPLDRYVTRHKAEPGQILNFMLQVSLSLYLANKYFQFTHYDLHGGNILCWYLPGMKPKEMVAIPYPFMGKTLYVKTCMIASIIDMGFARAEYQDNKYHNNIPEFRCYDRFYGLTDIFRLIMHIYNHLQYYENYDLIPYFEKMLSFFSDEDPRKILDACMESKCYNLPANAEIERLDCSFFATFLLQTFKMDFVSWEEPKDIRILGCGGTDICVNPDISPITSPTDKQDSSDPVVLFYLYANKGVRSFTAEHIEKVIIHGNGVVKTDMAELDDQITAFITRFGHNGDNVKLDLFDQSQMKQLYQLITTFITIYDRYHYMLTYIRAIYYINAIYFPVDEEPFYQFVANFRERYDSFFTLWKSNIHRDLYSLWHQINSARASRIIDMDKDESMAELLRWYRRSCNNIVQICVTTIPTLVRYKTSPRIL